MTAQSGVRLKALGLILMAVFYANILVSGKLYAYIGPRFGWLAIVAVGIFILLASSYRLIADQGAVSHESEGRSSLWPLATTLAPMLLALLIPAKPLGASAVSTRGVSTGISPRNANGAANSAEDRTVLDWAEIISANPEPTALNGQPADVSGFVYKDIRFGGNQFMVTRFTITCCVADALAVGIVVVSQNASNYPIDSWVQVKGNFAAGKLDGQALPVVVAEEVSTIQPPEQPYLFP